MNPEVSESNGKRLDALRQQIEATTQPEGQYRLLFESNPLPMWVIDRQTLRFLAVNAAAIHLYGYSKEEFLGMTVLDIHPQGMRARLSQIVANAMTSPTAMLTSQHLKKNGELIDVEITAQSLTFGGKPVRFAMAKDITDRKAAEAKLQMCLDIVNSMPIGVMVLHCDDPTNVKSAQLVDANPTWQKISGRAPEAIVGRTLSEGVPGVLATELPHMLTKVISSGKPQELAEFRYAGDGGSGSVFAVKAFPLPDNCVGVTFENITKSKQLEVTLRESEERFRTLIEGVKDYAFTVLDPAGRVVRCYAGAECILGHRAEERVCQRCSCFNPSGAPPQQDLDYALNVAAAQGRHEDEGWRLRRDGSQVRVNVVTTALRDSTGKVWGFANIKRDITGQHQAALEIASLAKFPDENSLPVLRVGRDGLILYANKASESLLRGWHCRRGDALPEHPQRVAAEALDSGRVQQAEIQVAGRIIALSFTPILEPGYVNVYGHDITDQKRLEAEVLEVSEKERQRIGQELHDGLSQEISGIAYMVNGLHKKLVRASAVEAADTQTIAEHLNLAKAQTRDLARLLNPVSTDAEGLVSALNNLATSITAVYKVSCRFKCEPPVMIRDPSTSNHLFRIAQEAVSNAIKHGQAHRILIGLRHVKDALVLTVRNNGAFFCGAGQKKGGMGLHIMNNRARAIGAILEIRRGARAGAVLTCSLPLSRLT